MSESPARAAERMSNDAFAGFIRLLLTPAAQAPRPSAEVDAYLAFLSGDTGHAVTLATAKARRRARCRG